MAHLWIRNADETEWAAALLTGDAYAVSANGLSPIDKCGVEESGPPAMLIRRNNGQQETWCLLSPKQAHVEVNGSNLALGVRVLQDRDEIVFRGGNGSATVLRGFFSTERISEVVPYPGGSDSVRCPRCKQPLAVNQLGVRCPACGVWHHQSPDLPCWLYAATCGSCPQPTELNAGFRWTPEEL